MKSVVKGRPVRDSSPAIYCYSHFIHSCELLEGSFCYNLSMRKPCLIIVHGLPATGKTSVSSEISKRLYIPVFAKDTLKEAMFDTVGYSDKAWSAKVSHASHRLMDIIIEQELGCRRSLMVEGNFKPGIDSDRFHKICEKYSATCLQLLCWAEGEGLYNRFQEREANPDRHPAHVHPDYSRSLVKELLAPGKAIPLSNVGDTSDFSLRDYTTLANRISTFIHEGGFSQTPATRKPQEEAV
jgi:predicted kinase